MITDVKKSIKSSCHIDYHQPQLSVLSSKFEFYFLNLNFVFWKQEMNIADNGDNLLNYCDMLLPLISTSQYFLVLFSWVYFLVLLELSDQIMGITFSITATCSSSHWWVLPSTFWYFSPDCTSWFFSSVHHRFWIFHHI